MTKARKPCAEGEGRPGKTRREALAELARLPLVYASLGSMVWQLLWASAAEADMCPGDFHWVCRGAGYWQVPCDGGSAHTCQSNFVCVGTVTCQGSFECGGTPSAYGCTTRDFECWSDFTCWLSGGQFNCGAGKFTCESGFSDAPSC